MTETQHLIWDKWHSLQVTLLLLFIVVTDGCWGGKSRSSNETITIDEVIATLSEKDRQLDSFSAKVSIVTYDLEGKLIDQPKEGIKYYLKPDMSLLCLETSDGRQEIYSEVGQIVRVKDGDSIKTKIVPDSFFLKDIRSLIAIHQGAITFPVDPRLQGGKRGGSNHPHFVFEPSGRLTSPVNSHHLYQISMEARYYEKVILRVDLNIGAVIEKEVIALPSGERIAYERHVDFVPINGSYLPGTVIYEYKMRRWIVTLWDYKVNIGLEADVFLLDDPICKLLETQSSRRATNSQPILDRKEVNTYGGCISQTSGGSFDHRGCQPCIG